MAERARKPKLTVELTAEQREQLQRDLGKEVPEPELMAEELEERIAPGIGSATSGGGAGKLQ